jgi:hypothetical protein
MFQDFMYEELLYRLTRCLVQLEQLRMLNPLDKEILKQKRTVRQRITAIEDRVQMQSA